MSDATDKELLDFPFIKEEIWMNIEANVRRTLDFAGSGPEADWCIDRIRAIFDSIYPDNTLNSSACKLGSAFGELLMKSIFVILKREGDIKELKEGRS